MGNGNILGQGITPSTSFKQKMEKNVGGAKVKVKVKAKGKIKPSKLAGLLKGIQGSPE